MDSNSLQPTEKANTRCGFVKTSCRRHLPPTSRGNTLTAVSRLHHDLVEARRMRTVETIRTIGTTRIQRDSQKVVGRMIERRRAKRNRCMRGNWELGQPSTAFI
jgi:hypothetical protein